MKRRLKPGAVPQIFYRASIVGHAGSLVPRKRGEKLNGNKRWAFVKGERFMVSV